MASGWSSLPSAPAGRKPKHFQVPINCFCFFHWSKRDSGERVKWQIFKDNLICVCLPTALRTMPSQSTIPRIFTDRTSVRKFKWTVMNGYLIDIQKTVSSALRTGLSGPVMARNKTISDRKANWTSLICVSDILATSTWEQTMEANMVIACHRGSEDVSSSWGRHSPGCRASYLLPGCVPEGHPRGAPSLFLPAQAGFHWPSHECCPQTSLGDVGTRGDEGIDQLSPVTWERPIQHTGQVTRAVCFSFRQKVLICKRWWLQADSHHCVALGETMALLTLLRKKT